MKTLTLIELHDIDTSYGVELLPDFKYFFLTDEESEKVGELNNHLTRLTLIFNMNIYENLLIAIRSVVTCNPTMKRKELDNFIKDTLKIDAPLTRDQLIEQAFPKKQEQRIEMDELCEVTSLIVDEVSKQFGLTEIEFEDENGDIRYTDQAQELFNKTLDIIDNTLN